MYTWGYIKENTLNKLGISEEEANLLGFLSHFTYYANEAMTQICSAVKPNEKTFLVEVTKEKGNVGTIITMPDDFIAFSDDVLLYKAQDGEYEEIGDELMEYCGYNQIMCHAYGTYRVPYKARWFFFTKNVHNDTIIPAPADICDALPSYIASQCFKLDDETKAAVYRNEFEIFLARIDDTSFKSQRGFHIGGGW
jgi:hypothetical protein